MRETWVQSLGWEEPLEKELLPILLFWPGEFHGICSPWGCKESTMTERLSLHTKGRGFPGRTLVRNPPANAGDAGLISGSERFPAEGNGNPLQYSCLENPMDRGAWQAIVHAVTRVGHDLVTELLLCTDYLDSTFIAIWPYRHIAIWLCSFITPHSTTLDYWKLTVRYKISHQKYCSMYI